MTISGGAVHVAARRPEMMKRTNVIIRVDEQQRQVVSSLSFKLVEESGPGRTDVPEIVELAQTRRTRRRMPPFVSTPAFSSSHWRFESLVTGRSEFASGYSHRTETGSDVMTRQRLRADSHPREIGGGDPEPSGVTNAVLPNAIHPSALQFGGFG